MKAESSWAASVRSEPQADCEAYKKDLRRVFDRELVAAQRERSLKQREVAIAKEVASLAELRSELETHDRELKASSEALRKWCQYLEETASKQANDDEEIEQEK